ncbi:MAG: aldehyde ferredoxin oxidoreductase C-terminal domain-containing protein [Candidatus Nezhaarchaeales archaeon]
MFRVMRVDLAERACEVLERPELREEWLGGSGAAISLLLEECPQGVDPFSPENPLVLAVGPLNGLFPCASKTVAAFKSPVTNNLGETHAGGRLGLALRMAGLDAIVIKGFSERPCALSIVNDRAHFIDASPLVGATALEAERYLRSMGVPGLQSTLTIGPAGERMVSYANVCVDRYNYFGRLGMGAVMGAKNLKAVSVAGTGEVKVPNADLYKRLYERVYDEVVNTEKMSKYHYVGTPVNVLALNAIKALPSKNFRDATYERAEEISGELIAEKYLEFKLSCAGCPLGCLHVAKLRDPFRPGYEYAPIDVYYNYESIYALGSNLCIGDAASVLRLIRRANELGMDTMLLGTALAWATEAYERGLISPSETIVEPKWGDLEAYLRMVDFIVSPPNDFYAALSQGPERASEAYGGGEFCLTIGGNGMPGYHTGYANILGMLVGARHSHNSNAGYSIDQRALKEPMGLEEAVRRLAREDDWRYVLTSLVICMFSREVYTEGVVVECLRAVGLERTVDELLSMGRRIYLRAQEFKSREGFSLRSVKVPERLFETPTPHGRLDRGVLERMLELYIQLKWGGQGA